jgi:hypothetical protein
MLLILDSNVFISDFWLRGTQFALLKDAVQRIGGELLVPEVVNAEVRTKYREKLAEAIRAEAKATTAVSDLLGPSASPTPSRDLDAACRAYGDHLDRELKAIGAKLLPIPEVSHQAMLSLALDRKRPFDNEGRGYRDALIWETILKLARERGGQISFVSMDSDFGTDAGLHTDLSNSLAGISRVGGFEFHKSLALFNDKWIRPTLEKLDDLVARLNRGEGPDVKGAILEGLRQSLLQGEDMADLGLGFPYDSVGVWVERETVQAKRFYVDDARHLSAGAVVIDVTLTFTVTLTLDIHFYPGRRSSIPEEVRRKWGIDYGDDFSMEVPNVELTVWCSVHLASMDKPKVEMIEVRMLEGKHGAIDLKEERWTRKRRPTR